MSTDLTFKKEVNVLVSAQAQRVLSHSGYSLDEFVDWCEKTRKFNFGGELAVLFLDQMPKKVM
jgi:hypothetical protein